MGQFGLPLLYALFVWWFSTGLILYLDGLPRRTYRWTMIGASILALAGLAALWMVRDDMSSFGAYVAFTAALALWGWNETAFLTGVITGPRRSACAPHLQGWARFVEATRMVLWHELAIAAGFALLVLAAWGGANKLGAQVYLLLWSMRLSAKVNIVLGVPYAPLSFLPDHLRYLASGFRIRAMNPLFPVVVTASTALCALLVGWSLASQTTSESAGLAAGYALLATLLALAILEHWFLVLPLPSDRLWSWGLRPHDSARANANTPIIATAAPTYAELKSKRSST